MNEERCIMCTDPTGKAGRGDGSIYLDFGRGGALGPLCSECWNAAVEDVAREAGLFTDEEVRAAIRGETQ